MKKLFLLAGLIAGLHQPLTADAQAVLDSANIHVEVIGLKRWTLQMLRDSLAAHHEASLTSHACGAVLRGSLRFPAAAVSSILDDRDKRPTNIVVTLVEPEDSSRIHPLSNIVYHAPLHEEWNIAYDVFKNANDDFQGAIQTYAYAPHPNVGSPFPPTKQGLRLWRFLREHRTDADRRQAMHTLQSDGTELNRIIAIVILGNFPRNDSTWLTLVHTIRDRDDIVTTTASQVLFEMVTNHPRKVAWSSGTSDLRAILDGTTLSALRATLQLLTVTHVSHDLGAPLLANGGELLLAILASGDTQGRTVVHNFLVQLSGKDYGSDTVSWQRWIRQLSSPD